MLQHMIAHFLVECLHLQRTKLLQQVFRYIGDDATHYEGPGLTINDQGGVLPEISIPILVGILEGYSEGICVFGISHHTQ